ncbi:type II toxin-antitoxin system ParD family antitoxin [Kovacikia minuta CCNUW1]|uniref:type II toxin-antitoxin system ParD family antitoxin n=1 Tax=Kovacikia minuta TaxID=2931930 RepID=UPI001CC92DB3|nr:type II toxin-antitoxin system ParD family antitoxin [Kovacikia minuta]UBF28842.1 type II toxin-antitoxin system ParD family antitoxin [Kovacikia minuta CCNUW1]
MQVRLSPALEEIVKEQIALGYADADAVVAEALKRLAEENQHKLESLRAELIKGEESGESRPYNLEEILADADAEFERGEVEVDPSVYPPTAS